MQGRRTLFRICAPISLAIASSALAQPASFTGLGNLDPNADPPGSVAYGLSADGTSVVGFSFMVIPSERRTEAQGFLWNATDGMTELPVPPFALPATAATGINDDGAVIVGNNGFTNNDYYEVRNGTFWTDVHSGSPTPQLMEPAYSINDVTADGTRLIGGTREPGLPWAVAKCMFYYTPATGIVEVGPLPGRIYSWGEACSADGSVMVGWGDGPDGITPIMWTQETGVTELAGRPDGYFGQAFGISADGTAIVGGYGSFDEDAFRWTAADGYVSLGKLDGYRKAYGLDCSFDGAVVAGYNWADLDDEIAFIWSERRGMHAVSDVLTTEYGLDLSGWHLSRVTGVSDDGTMLCGFGTSPSGLLEAWTATIPSAWGALQLTVSGMCPGQVQVRWSNGVPHGTIAVVASSSIGTFTIPGGPCAGTAIDLGPQGLQLVFTATSDANGAGSRSAVVGSNACGRFMQLIERDTCDVSNVQQIR